MLKFFEVEESSQKVILLITSQEFNKVPSGRGPFLSWSDLLSYEDLEIPVVCVSSHRSRAAIYIYLQFPVITSALIFQILKLRT